jgi:hypothetical protein
METYVTGALADTGKIVNIIEHSTATRGKPEGRSARMQTRYHDLGQGHKVPSATGVFNTGYLLPGTPSG